RGVRTGSVPPHRLPPSPSPAGLSVWRWRSPVRDAYAWRVRRLRWRGIWRFRGVWSGRALHPGKLLWVVHRTDNQSTSKMNRIASSAKIKMHPERRNGDNGHVVGPAIGNIQAAFD